MDILVLLMMLSAVGAVSVRMRLGGFGACGHAACGGEGRRRGRHSPGEDAEKTNALDDEQDACTSLDEALTDRHLRRNIKDIIVCLLSTSKV